MVNRHRGQCGLWGVDEDTVWEFAVQRGRVGFAIPNARDPDVSRVAYGTEISIDHRCQRRVVVAGNRCKYAGKRSRLSTLRVGPNGADHDLDTTHPGRN
jgi:hypothetical protein